MECSGTLDLRTRLEILATSDMFYQENGRFEIQGLQRFPKWAGVYRDYESQQKIDEVMIKSSGCKIGTEIATMIFDLIAAWRPSTGWASSYEIENNWYW